MTINETITALRDGAASDIWYDAAEYSDGAAAERIARTQESMFAAAHMLENLLTTLKGAVAVARQPSYGYIEDHAEYLSEGVSLIEQIIAGLEE